MESLNLKEHFKIRQYVMSIFIFVFKSEPLQHLKCKYFDDVPLKMLF